MILISYFGSIVHVEDKQETEESKESIKKNQMTIILTDLTEEKQENGKITIIICQMDCVTYIVIAMKS